VNGTGILNAWVRKNMISEEIDYNQMNQMAAEVPAGSEGLLILPFGNGAERMLGNRDIGSGISGLNFNIHQRKHFYRAAQEGIAFAFRYGIEIMKKVGIYPELLRVGNANMFLSPVFCEILSGITGATIELYDTDGSQGAARGAGLGNGYYSSPGEAFQGLEIKKTVIPGSRTDQYEEIYKKWFKYLDHVLKLN
jgi:xylulokinase